MFGGNNAPKLNTGMKKTLFNPWIWFETKSIVVDIAKPTVKPKQPSLPSIVLIHGANQTNTSFEFIRHALPAFRYINIDWSPTAGFQNNLDEMIDAVSDAGPVYLVGHSMGSIYAAHLSQHVECIGGATLSAPWGGSKAADWVRYMVPNYPLYKEVGTKSPIIKTAASLELPGRWTNFITTQGDVPGIGGQNDCVLTVESMETRKDIFDVYIDATHYEVLLSTDLIHSLGKNFLTASEKFQLPLDK
jgi:pimeloyl-ACP methyl ester carboxylesterase